MADSPTRYIYGFHAVVSRLRQSPDSVLELHVAAARADARARDLIAQAEACGVRVTPSDGDRLQRLVGTHHHQGVVARIDGRRRELKLADVLETLTEPALLLVLDGVTDPHNLGACLRVAAASGVDAVVVPKDRAAGLTPAVHRASAGTSLMVPLVQVTNLARCMEKLKASGVWIAGAAGEAEQTLYQHDYRGPFAFVLGAEGEGMRKLTREKCDHLIRIPMAAGVESLNVSVAAGVCLFEALRQRQ